MRFVMNRICRSSKASSLSNVQNFDGIKIGRRLQASIWKVVDDFGTGAHFLFQPKSDGVQLSAFLLKCMMTMPTFESDDETYKTGLRKAFILHKRSGWSAFVVVALVDVFHPAADEAGRHHDRVVGNALPAQRPANGGIWRNHRRISGVRCVAAPRSVPADDDKRLTNFEFRKRKINITKTHS